ncbi:MAG: tetratricopeptide repeat protein [Bacteroidetes bacterium]|jgi:TolA-binding protein|nr:tetratricopeptide repeat protein [Bacteroidota bacterium]
MARYILLFLIISGLNTLQAQQSVGHTNVLTTYQQALQLYQNHQYQAAKSLFEKAKSNTESQQVKTNSAYYLANTSIRLNEPNAQQKIEDFVRDYPTSPKRNQAYLDVAEYYFDYGNYNQALSWFKKVNTSSFSYNQLEQYQFQYGYTLFKTNNYKQAKSYFENLRTSAKYGADAKYYIGYMAYREDRYDEATELFEEVQQQGSQRELSYFMSDMNFKLGNFKKAIELGLKKLPKSNRQERSQLNKIIGESYFNLKQYDKALPYLKEYQGQRGKWNNTDYYQLGYAYYKQGKYDKAIAEFNKIIDGENAVAQNAYYHLAQAYIKTGKKAQALNAFKNAMEMDFDKTIKKDAFLNYAKLSYDIGNSYESVPVVLNRFLETYPDADEAQTIKNLLVNSYLTSKNYKEAIDLLDNSKLYEDKIIWQKANYYYAIEFFRTAEYPKALNYFNQSLSQPLDKKITAKATYWKAETHYNLGQYEEALIGFKTFETLPNAREVIEFKQVDYDIAYAYFKTKTYEKAKSHFKIAVIDLKNQDKLFDAFVRLGDTYFVTNDYWSAMENYNKALKMPGFNKEYVAYQKAISYGFVNKNETKIKELENYVSKFKSSVYLDDAYYQLGNTYIAENNNSKGLQAYQNLMTKRPQSPFVPKALSKIGLVYYNTNQNESALGTLKKLVSDYPATEEAQQAVQTVRLIYVDQQQPEAYANWVKGLDFINVTDADIDNTTYEAAENKFIDNKTEAAIKGFENYLKQFPKGIHALKAHFYLAQLYYNKSEFENSLPHYKFVAEASKSEFLEEALRKLSQIYLEDKNYSEAIVYLSKLETEANFTENKVFAQTNLMKAHYELENYKKTLNYADTVLKIQTIDDQIKSDAYIFRARSAIAINDEELAETAYQNVEKVAEGQRMAEALYYKAYFLNQSGEYEKSNQVIQNKLAKNYSRYREFGVKALVIMAKNYYALDDAYQANYILESVVKNYSDKFPEIAQQAQKELDILKAKEAKTNASVDQSKNQIKAQDSLKN